MPLDRLFAYSFRNKAGDDQFLYLVIDGRPVSRKYWSQKHANQTRFKSERTAGKHLKRKHPIDSNFLQMIKETKSNESLDKAVSSSNKLIEI